MNFGGLIGCEIFNGVNMEKSCENQKEPKMTLLLKIHLIHFMCRQNVCLVILVCFPRETRFLKSRDISVSNNF